MSLVSPNRRGGFTLVELLVSIAIIGMLMSLTSVAVWKVIQNVKSAKITVEVDQLAQAIQSYKEGQIQFPPCMALADNTNLTGSNERKKMFMRHISVAFPNCNYGLTQTNFNTLRLKILTTGTWGYNYSASATPLDLNTLDQAESLVFWLAGFPTPVNSSGVPIATRKLFGLHRDSDNPMKRDIAAVEGMNPLRYRTDPLFGFDQTRLVDNDGDGWLEYVPVSPKLGVSTAPYVYFDSSTYNVSVNQTSVMHLGYPRYGDTTSTLPADLFVKWGVAAPMAIRFDSTGANPTEWAKPTGFQIICAGLDGEYSRPGVDLAEAQRVPLFPSGFVFERGSGSSNNYQRQSAYTIPEYDNITNLSSKTLEGARSEAQQ